MGNSKKHLAVAAAFAGKKELVGFCTRHPFCQPGRMDQFAQLGFHLKEKFSKVSGADETSRLMQVVDAIVSARESMLEKFFAAKDINDVLARGMAIGMFESTVMNDLRDLAASLPPTVNLFGYKFPFGAKDNKDNTIGDIAKVDPETGLYECNNTAQYQALLGALRESKDFIHETVFKTATGYRGVKHDKSAFSVMDVVSRVMETLDKAGYPVTESIRRHDMENDEGNHFKPMSLGDIPEEILEKLKETGEDVESMVATSISLQDGETPEDAIKRAISSGMLKLPDFLSDDDEEDEEDEEDMGEHRLGGLVFSARWNTMTTDNLDTDPDWKLLGRIRRGCSLNEWKEQFSEKVAEEEGQGRDIVLLKE